MYKQRLSWYRLRELAALCEYNYILDQLIPLPSYLRDDVSLFSTFTDYHKITKMKIHKLSADWTENNAVELWLKYRDKETHQPREFYFYLSRDEFKKDIYVSYVYVNANSPDYEHCFKKKYTEENWIRHYFNRWRKYARYRRGSKEKTLPLMREIEDFWHKRIRETFTAWFVWHIALREWRNLIKKC